MGTDMRGYIEYCQGGIWKQHSDNWHPVRDYTMYGLLANVRGTGALYPPRGVPRDAASNGARRAYCHTTFLDQESLERAHRLGIPALPHAEAEQLVASGESEWFDENQRQIAKTGYVGESWLLTSEFRAVINHYEAHISETLVQEYDMELARSIGRYGEEAGLQHMAETWGARERSKKAHADFRIILTTMEAIEAEGDPARLIFWFA